ncbi:MAG: hypothetical protein HC906_14020 [Bacteroidales bacterium]|nr:hypothetical protein [Bacteroidales bacterium]
MEKVQISEKRLVSANRKMHAIITAQAKDEEHETRNKNTKSQTPEKRRRLRLRLRNTKHETKNHNILKKRRRLS